MNYKTLYLIDISSFIFRAFYAVRELTAPDGTPVNAVYGVASMISKLLEEVDPKFVAIVYDSKEASFRKEMYGEYKANRVEPPDTLIPQFEIVEKLIESFGLPAVRQSGMEADDLIATLRTRWIQENPEKHRVVIVSGDKDLMALVNSKTQVWDTMKDLHYTEHEVIEKFGVHPSQVRDYLAMVGDASDNIPGITGIGPKGAEQLLKEFGTLESVLKAAKDGKIKGKKGETIVENEKDALLSQKLATLVEDLPVDVSDEQLKYEWKPSAQLVEFFKKYNFKTLASKYGQGYEHKNSINSGFVQPHEMGASAQHLQATANDATWTAITTLPALKELVKKMEAAEMIAIDTETTGLDPHQASLVGISVALDEKGGYYIPVGHAYGDQLELKEVLQLLKPVFENEKIKKIGQNLKFDLRVLEHAGVHVDGIYGDTLLAAYSLDSSGRHNLDYLAQKYLNYSMISYEDVTGKGAKQITFDQVAIDVATRYSAEDAWAAFRLWKVLEPKLKEQKVEDLFRKVDLPMVEVVASMENEGIKVDVPFLQKLEKEFDHDLQKIEKKVLLYTRSGILNLNSPKQLAVFLFEELKLPVQSKTKTGYSTDASVLEALSPLHEVPKLLLEYREISKLKGTYVLPLQELRDPQDDRIRSSFHLTGTATGRLSSSDPNLQNIPTRTERGQKIRQAFIAEKNHVLLSADYSQIELRILAHLSGDENLVDSFQKGEDVHRRTASEIYHIKAENVTDEQRAVAKAINFGLMYGKTPFGLAEELKISRTEAKQMIDRYFTRYKGVKQYLDEAVAFAHEHKYVVTLLGRKRSLPEITASNPMLRGNAERMAMNSPIQGTASDLIKVAMNEIFHSIQKKKMKSKLLLQVHDELVFEAPKSEVEDLKELVINKMESAIELKVPLKVNLAFGHHWAEL